MHSKSNHRLRGAGRQDIHIHVHIHSDGSDYYEDRNAANSAEEESQQGAQPRGEASHSHDHSEADHSHEGHDHSHEGHDHSEADHSHEGHDHSEAGHSHEDHDHASEEASPVSIAYHEESVIGVFKYAVSEPYSQAIEMVEKKMFQIADAVDRQGGVIGHIKSFIVAESDRCMISITDIEAGPQRRTLKDDSAHFETVVIVLNIEGESLRKIIEDAYSDYIGPVKA